MGRKDKQRKKLRNFIKMKEQQRLKKVEETIGISQITAKMPINHEIPIEGVDRKCSEEVTEREDKVRQEETNDSEHVSDPDRAIDQNKIAKAVEPNTLEDTLSSAHDEHPSIIINRKDTTGSETTGVKDDQERVEIPDCKINTSFIRPIRKEILQDPESDLPGFVAGLIEEREEEYLETRRASQIYGAINRNETLGPATETNKQQKINALPEPAITSARLNVIMLSMYLGIFLAAIDNTIISTISAHIASEFKALSKISWVATGYLLSSATFQPLYGKVSDIFGRKPLLIFTNIAFLFGCLICGLSNSLWWLVFGRFVAGIGGGGMTSMSSITITDIVPLRERALYQGTCNFFFGLGTACGGIIGGWFSDSFGGWRMAFLIQVPLSAISTILILLYLELPQKPAGKDGNQNCSSIKSKLLAIDWIGATALVMFLSFFLITASLGGKEIPYNSRMFATLCLFSILSFTIFVYLELKVAKDPILPLVFLKDRSVLGSSLSNWFCMMAMMTTSYYLPIYFSGVLNMKPTAIGKRLAPNFFSVSMGSLGAGYYMKKSGKYYWFVILFCVITVLGQLQIYLIEPTIATWRQFILTMIPGVGTSVLITVSLLAMIAAVPHEHQASTTSISYAFRSVGCTLGVSIGSAIFRQSLNDYLNTRLMKFESDKYSKTDLLRIIKKASSSSEWVHESAPKHLRPVLIHCYHLACKNTFLFCLVCSVATLLSISIIREKKLHTSLNRTDENLTNENTRLLSDSA